MGSTRAPIQSGSARQLGERISRGCEAARERSANRFTTGNLRYSVWIIIISATREWRPMTIKVRCPLGHMLVVKDEHAGKKVRCPKCQAVMQAPACDSEETPEGVKPKKRLRLSSMLCGSGHRFAVRPEHFGLRVLCPVCQQPVRVVDPTNSEAPAREFQSDYELVGAGADSGGDLHTTNKHPLTDEMLDTERLWPLLLLVGSAAAVLVSIAVWLRQAEAI